MNFLNDVTVYFETLGQSVDAIHTGLNGLIAAFNLVTVAGGIGLFLLMILVIWQGMTIGNIERKLNRIEDMLMVRGIKDEGLNNK